MTKTDATFLDLAGGEKPGRKDSIRRGGMDVLMMAHRGEEMDAGAEVFFINMELSNIAGQVREAAADFRRGRKAHAAPRQLTTPCCQFFGRCVGGRALVRSVLTLSQAPQCGMRTNFTLDVGSDMSRLAMPRRHVKAVDLRRAIHEARRAYEDAAVAASRPSKGRYAAIRANLLTDAEKRCEVLSWVAEEAGIGEESKA